MYAQSTQNRQIKILLPTTNQSIYDLYILYIASIR